MNCFLLNYIWPVFLIIVKITWDYSCIHVNLPNTFLIYSRVDVILFYIDIYITLLIYMYKTVVFWC